MAIYLVTGQPGHGKTAYALDRAFKMQKDGRTIYASGVKDLDFDRAGFKYLDDPKSWQSLPDGSVILIDECYNYFPNRNPGSKVPDYVDAMARHRHRGFDFILVAQQGLQLDPFLRGLYEEHIHVRQTSILRSKTKLKRWTSYQANVNTSCADVIDWVRPSYVFDYYTSTTLVTTKRSMPMWLRWIIVGVIVLAILLLALKWHFDSKVAQFESEFSLVSAGATPASGVAVSVGAAPALRAYADVGEYVVAHLPRIATMPWSAPAYDARSLTADPQVYCMSSPGGFDAAGEYMGPSCTCITEQGTWYKLGAVECRYLARHGSPYNPYRQGEGVGASAPAAAVSTL
jgi:zona occludens toxin (predicted ATPase)